MHTVLNNTATPPLRSVIIPPYCLKKLLKFIDECRRYSKPKQCRFRDMVYSMTEKTIFRVHVHVSPSSAETLVTRGTITNHHMIACFISNISAKNYQHRVMCVEVIVCNISVVFLRHSVCTIFICIIIRRFVCASVCQSRQ